MTDIKDLRSKLDKWKGAKEVFQNNIDKLKLKVEENQKALRRHEKVREMIRKIGLKTQEQLCYNISEITSMALNSVLSNPYDLELEFVERRNKTECDIWFTRDGNRIKPFDGGGGAVDVASFALRIASWSMQSPRSRNTLILDEPFKHLKGEKANRRMLEMVHQVSHKLGIQIIMVSDERVSREATVASTDRLFETKIRNGITKIEVQ